MMFGTSGLTEANTPEQDVLSRYMQDVWVSFAKDPINAMSDQFAWPKYQENSETLVRIGYNNTTKPDFVKGNMYDEKCESLIGEDPQQILQKLN